MLIYRQSLTFSLWPKPFLAISMQIWTKFLTTFHGLYAVPIQIQINSITYFHWKIVALAGIWTRDNPSTKPICYQLSYPGLDWLCKLHLVWNIQTKSKDFSFTLLAKLIILETGYMNAFDNKFSNMSPPWTLWKNTNVFHNLNQNKGLTL